MTEAPAFVEHAHWWLVESRLTDVNGVYRGRCKHCGAERTFDALAGDTPPLHNGTRRTAVHIGPPNPPTRVTD